jgi:hypothetical protein
MKRPQTEKVAESGPEEIRKEYDFTKGVPNRYADRFRDGAIAVVLDPDVAARFPNAEAVNGALRAVTPPSKSRRKRRTGRRSG